MTAQNILLVGVGLIAQSFKGLSALNLYALQKPSRTGKRCATITTINSLTKCNSGIKVGFLTRNVKAGDDDDDDDDDEYYNHVEFDIDAKRKSLQKLPNVYSFGLNKGRSAPSQRKAMGTTSHESAIVNVCTNCGSEFIQWFGQCPTCREWNTIQPMSVKRSAPNGRPGFASSSQIKRPMDRDFSNNDNQDPFSARSSNKSSSWLGHSRFDEYSTHVPRPISDIQKQMRKDRQNQDGDETDHNFSFLEQRLVIPDNPELNTVLGGGIMPGSLTLLGGDPGVGKSTLLLQMAASVASLSTPKVGIGMGKAPKQDSAVGPVWYVSGEENSWQVASRAARLGIETSNLMLLCDTDADYVADLIANPQSSSLQEPLDIKFPSLVVIDSIQTMLCEAGGSSAPGGVTQVRETVALFMRLAKSTGIPIIMIGHVTKSGDVAGPRTVEHMVDCVLYLEGDNSSVSGNTNIRMLRASKNRFGSSDEIGVYTMSDGDNGAAGGALVPVLDPSTLFLSTRMDHVDSEGCAVSIVVEGSRCMAAEVQALVASKSDSFPRGSVGRRTVDGVSLSRVLLILAVLDKRYGIRCGRHDVYVNVVGGIRLSSGSSRYHKGDGSGSDLAVAVSLVSSLASIPVRADTAFVGEIGLVGELRPVSSLKKRITEAKRMGFSRIVVPKRLGSKKHNKWTKKQEYTPESNKVADIEVIECENLLNAINEGLIHKIYPDGGARRKSKNESSERLFTDNPKRSNSAKETPWRDVEDLLIIDSDDDFNEEDPDEFPYKTSGDFQ